MSETIRADQWKSWALAAEAERDRWKERAEKAAWLAEQDACALAAAEAERDRLERQVTGAEMTRSREYVRRCAAEATVSRQQERIEELEVTLEEIRDQHGFSSYTYGEMIPVCRCGRTLDGCPTYQFCEDLAELSAALEGTPDG